MNALCPGVIETAMPASLVFSPEMKEVIDAMREMGRMGSAEELAEAVV